MPLAEGFQWKTFFISADQNDVLASDQILGNLGTGRYKVWAVQAAASDGAITINDGVSNVVDSAAIPVRAAAVTYPEIRYNEDKCWVVDFIGRGPNLVINIADGTNAEIVLTVQKIG